MTEKLCGLPRTSALIALASSLYYCRLTIEDRDGPLWEDVDILTKHRYVEAAETAIRALRADERASQPGCDGHDSAVSTSGGAGLDARGGVPSTGEQKRKRSNDPHSQGQSANEEPFEPNPVACSNQADAQPSDLFQHVVGVARREGARVLGRIAPKEPV